MKSSKDVNSILLMNKFISVNKNKQVSAYLAKKILESKINASIENKRSLQLTFLILGFIFVGRLGL